jgi:hypothetical protein
MLPFKQPDHSQYAQNKHNAGEQYQQKQAFIDRRACQAGCRAAANFRRQRRKLAAGKDRTKRMLSPC